MLRPRTEQGSVTDINTNVLCRETYGAGSHSGKPDV